MFDVPGTDIVEVVLTEDCVRGVSGAEYVRRSTADSECDEAEATELRHRNTV